MIEEEGLRTVSDASNEELVKRYAVRPDGTSSLRLPTAEDKNADDAGIVIAER
jgi:hypothetical protein